MAIPKDDLIEALAPDPNNIEPLQMLFGWLGASSRKGYVRLYDSLELQVYVEFSEQDVVFTKSMKTSNNPLGGTLVWLPRDAKVISTSQNESQVTERTFLTGDLAQELQAAEAGNVFEDNVVLRPHTYRWSCRSRNIFCGFSYRWSCRTRLYHCPPPPLEDPIKF